ncbi:MAG TPA: M28 family metallopeptidase [Anaerolineae bacterium]|nr:M28 family metallopeptidase [Anaerolineae bacterium]
MTKWLLALLLLVTIFVSACGSSAVPTVTVAPMPPTPAFVSTSSVTENNSGVPAGQFDAARAYEDNRKLAVDIGKRVAGTPGGASAADYIASEFEKSGLTVTRQPFTFQMWEDRGTTVQIVAPTTGTLDAQPFQYSPAGQVEGKLVLVPGIGSRDDFSKVNVRGQIALVKRGTLTFIAKANNAQQAGASAIIVYNDIPQDFSGRVDESVSIPALGINGIAGDELVQQLRKGDVRVQIKSDTGVSESTGYNVIGTLRGASDETIVLGGHYDTVPAGPGAGDNGSGTATLIELARIAGQSKTAPQHTLVFIAFDAEELGLLGSEAYVKSLTSQQVQNIRAMLNFDMLGAGSGPLLLMGDGSVALLARSSAQELGIQAHNAQLPSNAGSDHYSFERRGVDTVFFMRDYRLLHTPEDTIDQVKPEYLGEAGRVAERLLQRLDATPIHKDSTSFAPTQ